MCWQDRDIGDSTQVQHHPVLAFVAHQCVVKRWRQGGALATGRHVTSAKVVDRRDAGTFRDDVRIAQLQRHRGSPGRRMRDRLAVAADCLDTSERGGCPGEERSNGRGEKLANISVQCRVSRGVQRLAGRIRTHAVTQRAVPGAAQRCQQPWRLCAHVHQDRIDRVHACSGHDADEQAHIDQFVFGASTLATIVSAGMASSLAIRGAVALRNVAISDFANVSVFGSFTRSGS